MNVRREQGRVSKKWRMGSELGDEKGWVVVKNE
jgi:hypothetical protein